SFAIAGLISLLYFSLSLAAMLHFAFSTVPEWVGPIDAIPCTDSWGESPSLSTKNYLAEIFLLLLLRDGVATHLGEADLDVAFLTCAYARAVAFAVDQ